MVIFHSYVKLPEGNAPYLFRDLHFFRTQKKAKASPGSPPRAWPTVHLIASRIWGEIAPKFERRPFEKMGRLMINYTNLEVQK